MLFATWEFPYIGGFTIYPNNKDLIVRTPTTRTLNLKKLPHPLSCPCLGRCRVNAAPSKHGAAALIRAVVLPN